MSYQYEQHCRSCQSESLEDVLSLGDTPLADRLLTQDDIKQTQTLYPLTLAFCHQCSLLQIRETVDPHLLFVKDYPYLSSVSPQLNAHFKTSAMAIMQQRKLDQSSLVIEAASNDGYMLQYFQSNNIQVLGIDPSIEAAKHAADKGVPTLNTFFNVELAHKLREDHPGGANVFLANNVLAHVADLNGFIEGIATLLAEDGIAIIEAPYVHELIQHCEFDTIYHQHLCYFSVTALKALFERHQLYLNDVETTAIHGGSLRLFIEKKLFVNDSVTQLLYEESQLGIDNITYYREFSSTINTLKHQVVAKLKDLKSQGYSIAAYGAAAKATTFMAHFDLDQSLLDFVVDKNTYKQGKFMGGNCLPIVNPETIYEKQPDIIIILAWNFAEEIIAEHQQFTESGGKFIIPIPTLHIV